MRSLRISPLMRRASPNGRSSNSGSFDETSKGLPRPNSTSSIDVGRCRSGGEFLAQAELKNNLNERRSHPGRGRTLDAGSPLSAVSTPTRSTSRSAGEGDKDSTLPDADRVHEKLQQMWDDGELSPRAPLDRSLGYISSSPNSAGKGAPGSSVASESAAGGTQPCRHSPQQQGVGVPLFINDVRALRQMAPFSSTEEQVLTRSQRRRSSANLLQQLVAAQPYGTAHQGHPEPSLQQEQGIATRKGQRQQHGPDLNGQQQKEQCGISESQQQQHQCHTVVEALDLSIGQVSGFNSLVVADALSRGIGARKRRASSPVVSTGSFSPREYHRKCDDNLTADAVPQPTGRKRHSAPRTSTQALVTADTTPAAFKASPRRNSANSAVPYDGRSCGDRGMFDMTITCTSSSNGSNRIESPFQKHPPPSPSDFPVSSPINTSAYSPQRNAPAESKQQAHQMQVHGTSATSGRPPARGPVGKEKQVLGSPLRTSPRRAHGEEGPSCPPFQTPRGPCSSLDSQEDTASASVRQRASQRCLSPLQLVSTGTPNRISMAETRSNGPLTGCAREEVASLKASDGHGRTRTTTLRVPSAKASAPSRRGSVALSARHKATPECSNTSLVPLMRSRQPEAAKGVTETAELRKAPSSPRKVAAPISSCHKQGSSGPAPSHVVASERQCNGQLAPAASPKHSSDRVERAASEPHSKKCCSTVREPGDSPVAAAATRRRSTARRSIGLASTARKSSLWATGSLSDCRSIPVPQVASQDVTDPASALITARSPTRFAKGAAPQERKLVAKLESSPSAAATQGSVAQRSNMEGACVGTSKGERNSTRTTAASKAATTGAVRRNLPRVNPSRHSAGKPRANNSKSLFHSAAARGSANVLPITKPRLLIPAPDKQKGANRITISCRPAGGAARGLRSARGKLPVCSSGPRGISEMASSQQGRMAVKCHSSIRTKTVVQVSCTASAKRCGASRATGSEVGAKDAGPVEQGTHKEDLCSHSLSQPKLSASSNEVTTSSEQSERTFLDSTEGGRRGGCAESTIGCTEVATDRPSSADIGVSARIACSALAQSSWDSVTAHSSSRRRSSSPHSLALQKGTSDDAGDDKRQSGIFPSLRRASSVCSLEDGDGKRVSAQQQKNEALHQEWEGRDREYQEKQQKLLQEQQRREILLAWEQREAELLKNRKALSKEEPSFWGFDPFMVDEEDEKVLTTEELRVEVSRFLKGDLRFHSRADLLRVVKKFSEQTRTTTTTTSSRLNFTKVDQRVVPMAARQVHGTVPHERRRKSILRNSSGSQQPSENRTRSRGISFSPFNKVQLYMLDEHERASKEAAAHLSQQGEQRQQLRQKLAHQFQLMLLRGESDLELALIRRELANLCDPEDEDSIAFLSPTLPPGRDAEAESRGYPNPSQQGVSEIKLSDSKEQAESGASDGSGVGGGVGRLPFTVSPSWRQRPNNMWQETSGTSQTESCAEWSPPPSPVEHSSLSTAGDKDGNGCWGTPISGAGSVIEREREFGRSENDENANCNATQRPEILNSAKEALDLQDPVKELPVEGPSKLLSSEATRRPSVLSRRLSVVPNVLPV